MKRILKTSVIVFFSIVGVLVVFVYCFRKYNQHKNLENAKIDNKQILDNINRSFGQKLMDIGCLDTSGKAVKLSHYKNKIIYLDFWAAHCGPCLEQAPYWESLITRFKTDTSFAFINVYIDNNFAEWKKQIKAENKQGISLFYDSKADVYAGRQFGVTMFPTYFFLDREGKILGYDLRPGAQNIKKKSNILVDWVLLQAKQGISAKDAALKYYALTTDYWDWSKEYQQKNAKYF